MVEARAGSGLGAAAAAAALWRAASEVWAVGSAREAPRVPGSAMEAARARAAASSAAMPPAACTTRVCSGSLPEPSCCRCCCRPERGLVVPTGGRVKTRQPAAGQRQRPSLARSLSESPGCTLPMCWARLLRLAKVFLQQPTGQASRDGAGGGGGGGMAAAVAWRRRRRRRRWRRRRRRWCWWRLCGVGVSGTSLTRMLRCF